MILHEKNQYTEALKNFDKALKLEESELETIYMNKARSLFELERYQETIEQCDNALLLDKENVEAIEYKGNSLNELLVIFHYLICFEWSII